MKIEKTSFKLFHPHSLFDFIHHWLDCCLFDNKCFGNSKWSEFDSDGPDTGALFHPAPNHRFDL